MGEKVHVLISEEEVEKRIREMGAEISEHYQGEKLHLVSVLKGGVFFTCELAKRITVPVSLDFMSVASYGDGTKSSGVVKVIKDLDEAIEGKHVLVVEDIVDSGRTLSYLLENLRRRNPKSLKLCTLDYTGFEIPDEFVVGCGLDYQQRHRNLPYVGVVELE